MGQHHHPRTCLYCLRHDGGFRSVEHIVPESLGNTEKILPAGVVCDRCNHGALAHLDSVLVAFAPIAFMRLVHGIPTKRQTMPKVKFGNLEVQRDGDTIRIDERGKGAVNVGAEDALGRRFSVKVLGHKRLTPDYLRELSRSLYKILLGLVCLDHGDLAYSERFHELREIILGARSFHGYLLFWNQGGPDLGQVRISEGELFLVEI